MENQASTAGTKREKLPQELIDLMAAVNKQPAIAERRWNRSCSE